MAIDCKDVPTNVTYDCANPWGQGCTSDKHFHFASLWKYTQNIQAACPNDSRLFLPPGGKASPQNASLTQASCVAIAGSDWTYYPGADIWTRLTTWKFPLLQLVASFPRPPLSFWVECFVIVHLLGDPIDTIENLLDKMSVCQKIAGEWRAECGKLLERPSGEDEDRDWKALALVTDAYGEWKEGRKATVALQQGLRDNPTRRKDLAAAIRQTGRALAADRSTKFLPIIVAQAFFIGTVGIAIFRTASAAGASDSSDTVFVNVEAHSIAFSAQYFWIIPAVFIGSIVGVSQTEAAIPRILRRFQIDVDRLKLHRQVDLPNACLDDGDRRIYHGGVYSWQPQRSHSLRSPLPYLIVIMGTVTGMAVSAFVPPDGWDCRHVGELLILAAWLLSARADVWLIHLWPLKTENRNTIFWITFLKDLAVTVATMGGIITTQVGVFNRCSCWTRWGKIGLTLPEMPHTAQILFHRINTVYPAITFASISIALIIIPLFICIRYRDALRTFVQRDDRKSNALWLWVLVRRYRAFVKAFQTRLRRRSFTLSRGSRTNTVRVEEGPPSHSVEMQPLTQRWSEEPMDIAASNEDDAVAGPVPAPAPAGEPEPVDLAVQSSSTGSTSRSGTETPSSRPEARRRFTEQNRATT